MNRLAGKVAIVTGAGRGMGRAIGNRFVAEGAKVILCDIDGASVEAAARELGGDVLSVPLDVADGAAWRVLAERAVAAMGGIDILVNNAGITGPSQGMLELDEAAFDRVCAINQTGTFLGMQAVIPSMLERKGGAIINISSISGLIANYGTNNAAYAASKFAVRGLTKFAAIEFADRNIRVNSVHPGYTRTPMLTASLDNDQIAIAAQSIPAKRVGEPEEVASLVTFLASDEACYITGIEHVIDGGYSIT